MSPTRPLACLFLLVPLVLVGCRVEVAEAGREEASFPLTRGTTEVMRMRAYLAKMYEPGAVRESFVDDFGDAIDCVEFRLQPAIRLQGIDPDRGRMPSELDDEKPIALLTRIVADPFRVASSMRRASRTPRIKYRSAVKSISLRSRRATPRRTWEAADFLPKDLALPPTSGACA